MKNFQIQDRVPSDRAQDPTVVQAPTGYEGTFHKDHMVTGRLADR